MLVTAAAEPTQTGTSGAVLEWVQVFAPAWGFLGVVLGFYLTMLGRYAAFNEQHVRIRVEAARDSFLAAHLAAYRIADRLRLDDGQELADLWRPELALEISTLGGQLFDHAFMLDGRGLSPSARFSAIPTRGSTRSRRQPGHWPARRQPNRVSGTEWRWTSCSGTKGGPERWREWEDRQWDLVRTPPAKRYRAKRRRARRSSARPLPADLARRGSAFLLR